MQLFLMCPQESQMLKYLPSAWDSAYKDLLIVSPWVLALHFVQVASLWCEVRLYVNK